MTGNFTGPQRPSPQFAHYENVTLLGPPTMRGAIVFAGSSHPRLVEGICDRLGTKQGHATLGKFKNGETSVTIRTFTACACSSFLTWHRYIDSKQGCLHCTERKREVRRHVTRATIANGSRINDSVMELLIMISACKGGSAKSITGTRAACPRWIRR
jgi:ribose-phosphate pyrophosphokinase